MWVSECHPSCSHYHEVIVWVPTIPRNQHTKLTLYHKVLQFPHMLYEVSAQYQDRSARGHPEQRLVLKGFCRIWKILPSQRQCPSGQTVWTRDYELVNGWRYCPVSQQIFRSSSTSMDVRRVHFYSLRARMTLILPLMLNLLHQFCVCHL